MFGIRTTFFPQLSFSLGVNSQTVMYLEESFVICEHVVMEKRDENCLVPSENIFSIINFPENVRYLIHRVVKY
jgi:hypothetical protein